MGLGGPAAGAGENWFLKIGKTSFLREEKTQACFTLKACLFGVFGKMKENSDDFDEKKSPNAERK